ncbi:MAG TPA: proline dehydrogenase family protein, partial [Burkholderiaceae bacterium]|nr:proline dehydrogenase family protein [Burkholderiaceae bacterium]
MPQDLARLGPPVRDELRLIQDLLGGLKGALDWDSAASMAGPWVQAVRHKPAPFWALESLLREYPISSAEGLALMRLAEALLRVPDTETAIALTADQLGRAEFGGADKRGDGPHRMLASLSASAIALSKKFLPDAEGEAGLFKRLGANTVVAATVRAIQLLGRQFVLGQTIAEALAEAHAQRRATGKEGHPAPLRFSFDMLGEGARTLHDAQRYLASYHAAIAAIASSPQQPSGGPEAADGISIKLSALFPRYEAAQHARVMAELLPRVVTLVDAAARANINLTIDAEESDRLELSLDLLDALAAHVARTHAAWRGFGLAVQAYQLRSLEVVHEVARIARAHGLRFMVRLVKGAYWDGEIKRAQEMGLAGYPVFTHKHHTDIAYLACARALLAHHDVIYPQFATHNAGTIAAILQMAQAHGAAFELQRLHGMGEAVYREVAPAGGDAVTVRAPVRVYAPVGEHRDLLAYLVRRLLENGANSSFVHQLADPAVAVEALLVSPLHAAQVTGQPLPVALYGSTRANSRGLDLADAAQREPLLQALATTRVAAVAEATPATAQAAMATLHAAWPQWNATPLAERCAVLRRAADALEARLPEFCALLAQEGFKTWADGVSEVREAVDFCRYYASEALHRLAPQTLPGPTGESNELRLHGRGVFVCISPWNFP